MPGIIVEFYCDAMEGKKISRDYLAFPITVFCDYNGRPADLSALQGSSYATVLYVGDVLQDPYTYQFNRKTETLLIQGETFDAHARLRLVFKFWCHGHT